MVKCIKKLKGGLPIAVVEEMLNTSNHIERLTFVNWEQDYPYTPNVEFVAMHDGDNIYLKFYVDEQTTMAVTTEDMGPVWCDSCVEFFVSLDGKSYYNFEFNAIGTALLSHRVIGEKPVAAPTSVLQSIERYTTLPRGEYLEEQEVSFWALMVKIPRSAFFAHSLDSLSGLKASGNFYKCGDNLTMPHFLSWSYIDSAKPNFHLPAYFGKVVFDK